MDRRETFKINISAPNLINLCVDAHSDEQIAGRIYHFYSTDPTEFINILNLLSSMEELFNRVGYPQESTKSRSFTPALGGSRSAQKPENGNAKANRAQRPPKAVSVDDLLSHRGDRATFFIHVRYRQNSEWQGMFACPETRQTQTFSSTLDFIKLISNLLDSL